MLYSWKLLIWCKSKFSDWFVNKTDWFDLENRYQFCLTLSSLIHLHQKIIEHQHFYETFFYLIEERNTEKKRYIHGNKHCLYSDQSIGGMSAIVVSNFFLHNKYSVVLLPQTKAKSFSRRCQPTIFQHTACLFL